MRTCEQCGRPEEGQGDMRLRWHLIDGTTAGGETVSHDFCTAQCLADYAKRIAAEEAS